LKKVCLHFINNETSMLDNLAIKLPSFICNVLLTMASQSTCTLLPGYFRKFCTWFS